MLSMALGVGGNTNWGGVILSLCYDTSKTYIASLSSINSSHFDHENNSIHSHNNTPPKIVKSSGI